MARLARLIGKVGSELLHNGSQIQRQIVGVKNDNHRQTLRFEEGAAARIAFAGSGYDHRPRLQDVRRRNVVRNERNHAHKGL